MPGTQRRSLDRGGILFGRGDAPFGMFYLVSGKLRLRRFGGDGDEMTMAMILPGNTFAEASLFSPEYHCDCIAEEESLVAVFPQHTVLAQIEGDPLFAKALVNRLAAQLQESRLRSEIRAIRKADERVLAALSLLAGNAPCFRLKGTVKQFAGEIGLAHEVLYRTLAKLEARGRIRRQGGAITLL
ncbi:MAG: Crp/Fnr family transcriptional regulator [Rhodospirillales bacterium]|nr:Crp/Fnr family transcriptional regulator [Rhodospirillales bacterium]